MTRNTEHLQSVLSTAKHDFDNRVVHDNGLSLADKQRMWTKFLTDLKPLMLELKEAEAYTRKMEAITEANLYLMMRKRQQRKTRAA